jgi:hypothetical protein
MGPILCPETSLKDYHSTLRDIPEERRYHEHRGGSLTSRKRNKPEASLSALTENSFSNSKVPDLKYDRPVSTRF